MSFPTEHPFRPAGPPELLCGGAVIITEQAAQSLTTSHLPVGTAHAFFRFEERVPESLMVALSVIMMGELDSGLWAIVWHSVALSGVVAPGPLCLLFIHPCAPNLISLRLPGPCRHDFVVCSCSRLCLQGSSRASSRESRSSAAARRAPPFGETDAALECRPRVLGAVVGASAVGSRAGAVLRRRGLSVSPRPVPKLGPFEIDHKSAA